MSAGGLVAFSVRAVSEVLHRIGVLWRLTFANLTTFCFWRPLPLSTTIYGKLRILHRPCRFSIGPRGRLGDGLYLATSRTSTITAGADVTINLGCVMVAMDRITIGDQVAIAEYVTIRDQEHRFAKGNGVRNQGYNVAPVEIGDNVWIGRGVYIGPGSKIGANSIVGANSLVRGAFPEGVLIAGTPAVVKKHLFSEDTAIPVTSSVKLSGAFDDA